MLAVYPGSFDPPTVAHVAIARAALGHVDEVRLVLSEVALGKEDLSADRVGVEARRAVLEDLTAEVPGLGVAVTTTALVAEISVEAGADAVVVGSDKWAQILDPSWYGGSVAARDAALRRIPRVLHAVRPGATPPPPLPPGIDLEVVTLEVDPEHGPVSSTRVRRGEVHLMAPAARRAGHWAVGPPTRGREPGAGGGATG